MKPPYARPLTVLSVLALCISTGSGIRTVSSHTLSAPDTVYAHDNGDFPDVVYQFTIMFSDTAQCGDLGWWSVTNIVDFGIFDLCDCRLYGPGQYLAYEVYTDLKDNRGPGVIENYIYFCGVDSILSSRTIVMPYGPTESVPATWGRVKALYRN